METIPARSRGSEAPALGWYLRWAMAGCSLAAAGIHFAFAPAHFGEYWAHGAFFLVLAWFQVLWALLVVTRPTRSTLALGAVVNVAVIGVWVVSRTVGVPVGPNHAAEAVGLPDVLSTAFEALIVVGAAALALRPALADRRVAGVQMAAGCTAGLAVLALFGASVSLTPTFTEGHSHGHSATATSATTGHDATAHNQGSHDHTAAPGAAASGASGATATAHDHTAALTPFNGDSPCEQAAPNGSEQATSAAAANEGHNHRGPNTQELIDQATRVQLEAQQVQARTVIDKYPTVADAERDGYRMSTVYLPCIGAHYTKVSLVGQFDPAAPSELLFDGTRPDSKIVGLSYLVVHPGGPPDGFAGPNDRWHQHSANGGLCLNKAGLVVGGESISAADCQARGGNKVGLKDIWMLHDWVAPAWECSWGVFAGECPELGGRAGGTAFDASGRAPSQPSPPTSNRATGAVTPAVEKAGG